MDILLNGTSQFDMGLQDILQSNMDSDWEVYTPEALAAEFGYLHSYREWRQERRACDEDAPLELYAEELVQILRIDTDVLDIIDEYDNLIGYAVKIF